MYCNLKNHTVHNIILIVSTVTGSDFTVTDPLEVVFLANMVSSGATSCATIFIVDDTTLEGPHSFGVSIVGSDPPLMITDAQASVSITDDEGMSCVEFVYPTVC